MKTGILSFLKSLKELEKNCCFKTLLSVFLYGLKSSFFLSFWICFNNEKSKNTIIIYLNAIICE
ncbi:hypothetical protein F7190_04115 [Helicobacter pylori]|nr:hypothetical protein [Helicobacter pylori]